jgi:hypothetical protein
MGMQGCRGAQGEKRPREGRWCETRGGAGPGKAHGEAGGTTGRGAKKGAVCVRQREGRAGRGARRRSGGWPGPTAAGAQEAEAGAEVADQAGEGHGCNGARSFLCRWAVSGRQGRQGCRVGVAIPHLAGGRGRGRPVGGSCWAPAGAAAAAAAQARFPPPPGLVE